MADFQLRLISPEEELFKGNVQMVVIPGEEGDFAAMPLHSPLITYLRPGKIEILDNKNDLISSFFTGSGFVKVDQFNCLIMTDYIKKVEELDSKNIDIEIKKVEGEIYAEKDKNLKERLFERLKILKEEQIAAAGK